MPKSHAAPFCHVLLSVLNLIAFCTPSFSQAILSSNLKQEHASYYHFNEKITLPVSSQWLCLKLRTDLPKPPSTFTNAALQTPLLQKSLAGVSVNVTNVSARGFHLVKLSGPINLQMLMTELAQRDEIAFVTPVLLSGRVRQMVTDEFIVSMALPLHDNALAQLCQTHGALIMRKLNEQTFLLKTVSGKDGLQAANEFHALEGIAFAQPNFIYPASDLRTAGPNDPYFTEQWALQNLGQSVTVGDVNLDGQVDFVNGVRGADIDAVRAWEMTRGHAQVKIAVLDSGIELDHPDLQANVIGGYDAIARDSVANDDNFFGMGGHGTAAAGIIAAVADNGIGISGLAPHCKLMPIRVFDENTTDDLALAAGIRAAVDLGADVLSNSWGGGSPSAVITAALDYAHTQGRNGRGCVLVFSSGNAGEGKVLYPAVLTQVIAVGASNMFDEKKSAGSRDGQLKWGSNYGTGLDVVAPTLVYTTDLAGAAGYSPNDYYRAFDGTSAAAPHVAALAGLLLSLNPALAASEVQNFIESSCDKIGRYTYDVSRPNGGWNKRFGYGRINAYRALKRARGEDVVPPHISHTPQNNLTANTSVKISAQIMDENGVATHAASTSTSGTPIPGEPNLIYRVNSGVGFGAWQFLSNTGGFEDQRFDFILPQQPHNARIEYYLAARDESINKNYVTFPRFGQHEQTDNTVPPEQCFTFFWGELTRTNLRSSATPQTISAENSRVVSPLEVPASFRIADVEVHVDIRHDYLSDLILVLESPRGTRVTLSSRNGEGENDYQETTFDDEAAIAITAGVPPYHGAFQPDEALAQFDGEDVHGVWKLIVLDRVDLDGGVLENWGLTFSHVDKNSVSTRVSAALETAPTQFQLHASYPNPFTPTTATGETAFSTKIAFAVPSLAEGSVTLKVYNILGQVVRTLVNRELHAGKHEAWWDGKDETGRNVAAGTYLYTLQAGQYLEKKKLLIMR